MVPEKAIFRSVIVYSKNISNQSNLPFQIEQVHDTKHYHVHGCHYLESKRGLDRGHLCCMNL